MRSKYIKLFVLIGLLITLTGCGDTKGSGLQDDVELGENIPEEKVYNVATDTLPYSEETIYEQLFDINSKIAVEIDISDEVLQRLQRDYEEYKKKGSKSPIYREADLRITIEAEGEKNTYVIENAGIRMKGNTSRTDFYEEKTGQYNLIHFKVDFGEKSFATLEKLELRWNKNDDGTYVREYYAYEMYRDFGVLAPHINLATMRVAGEHQGIFTVCEPVDKRFIEKYVAKVDRGGDLYKCGWSRIGANLTSYCSIGIEDEEKGKFYNYDLKTNKTDSSHERMKNLLTVLNKKGVTREEIAEVVDIENFLAFEAVSYFTGNPDDMRNDYNNYYIYFLESSGKAIFIPYDVDRVFGLTKDWNPLGNAMTDVNPFSTKAESIGKQQENPLYVNTVCEGGYYVEEFGEVLREVAASKWLTTEQFKSVYEIAVSNYARETKPDKTYDNARHHRFMLDNGVSAALDTTEGNVSFEDYLRAKLRAYYNYCGQ